RFSRDWSSDVCSSDLAIYGGLIFVESSPRAVNEEQAHKVMAAAPLSYVGVFRNADINDVAAKADALSLSAVQLHGDEDQAYIDRSEERRVGKEGGGRS